MPPFEIGIFDPGFFDPRHTYDYQVIDQLFEFVPKAEQLGYHRYWLGEHYEYGIAWRSPEILLSLLAGFTDTIRIGVAGVLLRVHSPLKVVQNYKLLEYLFDDRIDLGIAGGKAPKNIMPALLNGVAPQQRTYEELIEELIQFMDLSFPPEHPYRDISTPLQGAGRPEMWLLASGSKRIPVAVKHDMNFCLSLFHLFSKEEVAAETLQELRYQYEEAHDRPAKTSIAVAGVCADSYQKALALKQGYLSKFFIPKIYGTPSDCMEQLYQLQENYQVDEIIFLDLCQDFKDRTHSLSLLSEELGLSAKQLSPSLNQEI